MLDSGNADPAARAAALDLMHRLPTPPGLDTYWSVFVQILDRAAVLAEQVHETDQDAFDQALSKLTAADPDLARLSAQVGQADIDRVCRTST